MTKLEQILADIYTLESALKTLGYAMDSLGDSEIYGNIAGCVKCILSFENKISDDMERLQEIEAGDGIKEDEVELLTIYRLMSPERKENILNLCQGWRNGYNGK